MEVSLASKSPEITFGSIDGEAFAWVPGEAWVLKGGSWVRVNSAELGNEGRVLSKAAFDAKFGSVPPLPSRLDLKELQQALDDERREVRNLTVMGMRPDLRPEDAELVRNLERSARAGVKLARQALQYHMTPSDRTRRQRTTTTKRCWRSGRPGRTSRRHTPRWTRCRRSTWSGPRRRHSSAAWRSGGPSNPMNKAQEYAQQHRRFLEQHRPDVLAGLRQQNDLDSYLSSIGEQAESRFDHLMAEHGNSKAVQSLPHLERVSSLQNRQMEIEELIQDELINQPLKD
jgi:hypothetical protein